MTMLDSALRAREKGAAALNAGDISKADRLLMAFVARLLSVAVMSYDETEGRGLLRKHLVGFLPRIADAFDGMLTLVDGGTQPARNLGGRYQYLVVAHVSHLVGDAESARRIAAAALHKAVTGTPFWDLYARVFNALIRGEEVVYAKPVVSSEEAYWLPYLEFMRSASEGLRVESLREGVRESFEARNANKRLNLDAHQIEGTGKQPAMWDFRASALEEAVTHHPTRVDL